MERLVNPDEMWTCQERLDIRSENFWGKLRVKYDKIRKFYYYDILIGKKGKKDYRVHLGFDLIGNCFFNENRDKVEQIERNVESALHGKQSSEVVNFQKTTPQADLKFSVEAKGSAAESKVNKFEIIES